MSEKILPDQIDCNIERSGEAREPNSQFLLKKARQQSNSESFELDLYDLPEDERTEQTLEDIYFHNNNEAQ